MGIGIIWVLVAAISLGFYALPSKYTKGYAWDNTWAGFFLLAMFVVPLIATFSLVDGLAETYAQVPSGILVSMMLMSFLWGVGIILWGQGIARIGVALGFSLLIGTVTLLGSILPFFLGGIDNLKTSGGLVIILGIAIILIGIIANGKAGLLRDKNEDEGSTDDPEKKKNMRTGIIICVVGGICAAGFNLSYHVGDHLGHIGQISQEQFGNSPWIARLAVMLPIFIGSGIASVFYFVWLLTKNKTWGKFTVKGSMVNMLLILIMAVFHDASLILYGLGAYLLGALGTSVGFAIFEAGSIMVANFSGLATGEWSQAGKKSKQWLYGGLLIMILGILFVSWGNAMLV